MTKVSASLAVGYETPDVSIPLTLEMHQGPYARYGWIPLRLYPVVPAILRATVGTVEFGETREEIVEEILKFGGERTATLKRPIPTAIEFFSIGVSIDASGDDVFPTLHYDPARLQVVSDVPFYGGYRVKYQAQYQIVYYRYFADYLPYDKGFTFSYGTVFAFYDKESASIEVKPDTSEQVWTTELYRVYSTIVLDANGAWEMPPGWEEDGSYPDHPEVEPLDKDNSFDDERKHRVGYINRLGTISWQWFFTPPLDPYSASDSYKPKYKLRWATPPDDDWKDVFKSVDKTAIKTELTKSYPGLT